VVTNGNRAPTMMMNLQEIRVSYYLSRQVFHKIMVSKLTYMYLTQNPTGI